MKKHLLIMAAGMVLLTSALIACGNNEDKTAEKAPTEAEQFASVAFQEENIKRGEYLVNIMGCHDCHTPKVMTEFGPAPDTTRLLSGYNASIPLGSYDTAIASKGEWVLFNGQITAFAGPGGLSYAANLTPDETGIGGWTLDHFRKALKEGKSKGIDGGRPLLPPMPWQYFRHINDEDLSAIFDYLKSLKPVNNRVPAPMLAKH